MYVCNVLAYLGLYLYARMGQVVSLVALLRAGENPAFFLSIYSPSSPWGLPQQTLSDRYGFLGNYRMLGSRLTTAFHALLALRVRWQQRYSCARWLPWARPGTTHSRACVPKFEIAAGVRKWFRATYETGLHTAD